MRWLLILVALSVFAQEGHQVAVPVVVTSEGHHIPHLKATDFRILEDGRPQRITAFTEGSPASSTDSNADPSHTYVIVIDALHSTLSSFDRVRGALTRFVDRELSTNHPGDQYALMVVSRNNKVVEDATSEPTDLLTALRSAEFPEFVRDSESSNVAALTEQFISLIQLDYCNLCGGCGGRPPRNQNGCSGSRARVQSALASFSDRALALNLDFLSQLEEIVRSAARFEGSRTILFISDGFARFPGRELYSILRDGYGVRDTAFQANPRDTQPQLEAVLRLATASNVRFYTLDSRRLYSATSSLPTPETVDSQARANARESTDALAELAHQTGGIFYENSNDLLKGIRQAFADGRDYYLLAYVSDNKSTAETWRKISVTTRNPQYRTTAKPGYWPTRD